AVSVLSFPACAAREPRLAPAASSRMPLALPATACSAPLAPPEQTGRAARRVTLHHTASEPLYPSSPRTDLLVRIDLTKSLYSFWSCPPPSKSSRIPICSSFLRPSVAAS